MIKLKNVSHCYQPGIPVIEEISFHIAEGEYVALTGPSGSGKTTIARIVAGHLVPNQGKVMIDDEDSTGKPSRKVILISQESDLFPWQTSEKHILFALRDKNQRQAKELLDLVRLTGYERFYPSQLSGGMKKRLSLARALAINPKLLILDEAFGSLDLELKYALYEDLERIWRATGTTILFITHNLDELKFAQREIKLSVQKPSRVSQIIENFQSKRH